MIAISKPRTATSTPAAGYIRMSGWKQEKSPDEQREQIEKLAAREGCRVVEWDIDEAISGDSGTADRPGLANLLAGAQAGTFKVVLAWHTNRISREDPMDAVVFYSQLRKAGVRLHTVCEGAIDLEDFAKQLLLFINQKGNNDYLIELSAKVVRGKIANAKRGGWNGGVAHYGLDRGLFDAAGQLVRRLQTGEHIQMAGHRVRLVPSTDPVKVEAIRYAYHRMDTANLRFRELARELTAKGYPSPRGTGWTHTNVARLLTNRAYVGMARWGATAWGEYHEAQGEEIVPIPKNKGRGRHTKPEEDVIAVERAHEGIIDPMLFERIQCKLAHPKSPRSTAHRRAFPLSDLIYCKHCGNKMIGETGRGRNRQGKLAYTYLRYVCSRYAKFGKDGQHNRTCGHHAVDAARVLGWLVHKLREVYLGPGRAAMVQEIKRQLGTQAKANSGDVERLQKRAADLDRQVARLVKAIRTVDAAELVEELVIVRGERDRVKAELAQADRSADAVDLDTEADQIADSLQEIGERLTTQDPAILREVLHRFVSKITCRWEHQSGRRRSSYLLVEGRVELRPQTLSSVCGLVGRGIGSTGP